MELNNPGAGFQARVEIQTTTVIGVDPVTPPSIDQRKALQLEPAGAPVMYQTWSNLLFLHWEWDPAEIQALLPPGLYVDRYGEKAYVAVTPFFMEGVRASFLPEIPGASNFLELNVRTYVHDRKGVPGVWFFSLDCNQSLAVAMAKVFYSLPYKRAEMKASIKNGLVEYSCQRQGEPDRAEFNYRQENTTVAAPPGSLPFFLAERYLLYSFSERTKKIYTARIHHQPWHLFRAHLDKFDETMLRMNGLNPRMRPPEHRWFASPVRVKIYSLQELV